MYSEDDFIAISAVQHYVYCPRQCALIHLERAWSENQATAEGRLRHERTHSDRIEMRGDIKIAAGLLLCSSVLGVSGQADVVEFHREGALWRPFPVEYKRGRSKRSHEDRIQLCLQALCLEEMLELEVPAGALFYGKTRRREQVEFGAELRERTRNAVIDTHMLLAGTVLPPPAADGRCRGCSLLEECRPGEAADRRRSSRYLEKLREEV